MSGHLPKNPKTGSHATLGSCSLPMVDCFPIIPKVNSPIFEALDVEGRDIEAHFSILIHIPGA